MAPFSSNSTSVTRKCFSLKAGFTAVHLLFNNFFGFNLFIIQLYIPIQVIEQGGYHGIGLPSQLTK